jgi:hypothetical protein
MDCCRQDADREANNQDLTQLAVLLLQWPFRATLSDRAELLQAFALFITAACQFPSYARYGKSGPMTGKMHKLCVSTYQPPDP